MAQTKPGPNRKKPAAPAAAREWRKPAALCLLLALLVIGAFLPVLRNGFINYDDSVYVTGNARVQQGVTWQNIQWAFRATDGANWHPLTFISHMLDCGWFGTNPWGHHLTSLILHTINTLLVFLVFRAMTGAMWRSFFVAALFGVHPLHVESVAWVAERKDVLSTCFWLMTILAYLKFHTSNLKSEKRAWYALTLAFFILGLLSKPMLVTLPFTLLLLDFWPLRRLQELPARARWTRLILEKLPLFVLSAAVSIVTMHVQRMSGAMERLAWLTFGQRLCNALVAYVRYLDKLLWPANLAIFYPHPGDWPAWIVLPAAAALIAISAGVWIVRRRSPYLLFGWLWFVGTLVPVIGLVQVGGQSMADRYTYVPLIGIFVMLVWGFCELNRRWRLGNRACAIAGATVVLACALLARRQVGFWLNSGTLFQHALDSTTRNHVACFHLGDYLLSQGQRDEAIAMYRQCLDITPGMEPARNNLASALLFQGRVDEAIAEFHRAINLPTVAPEPHNGLGIALENQGHLDEAIAELRRAVEIDPSFFRAHVNLANALAMKGRRDEAIAEYQVALKIQPDSAEVTEKLREMAKKP